MAGRRTPAVPVLDEERGESVGRWTRSGRRVDVEAGGVRDEDGVTLDDATATVQV